ncbi:hypothetical protein RFI_26869 [Reticulomyxa filosa]|uniref:PI3K/PI4K catalytic domain-containing protein n=1 Tax=Reticulomyxa filosa TaxID=46433 RepID=X6M931_RETFI|nr:hypothetical protein RFI_26869 [Reticulomyxa filosa]|eukprot:ETO10508.1 hypothetical protein RFI_26869 [Reticulomyxa filosa]
MDVYDFDSNLTSSFILKYGDDLRKDAAVLQMFRFMNSLWEENELYYHGKQVQALTYACLPLGTEYGIIELIPNCKSLQEICEEKLKLQKENQKNNRRASMVFGNDDALFQLIATCAGSYIAAYVMGIRDRHYDNVLIREDGTVFHIDFGYMLGFVCVCVICLLVFFEKVAGLDTNKFAITSDLSKLMGHRYQEFVDIGQKAWLVLRENAQELLDYARVVFAFLYPEDTVENFIKDVLLMHLDKDKAAELEKENTLLCNFSAMAMQRQN